MAQAETEGHPKVDTTTIRRRDLITEIQGFNRYYTNIIGLLDAGIAESEYSLTEARIIYEISKPSRKRRVSII